jgi:hypothetical protein
MSIRDKEKLMADLKDIIPDDMNRGFFIMGYKVAIEQIANGLDSLMRGHPELRIGPLVKVVLDIGKSYDEE